MSYKTIVIRVLSLLPLTLLLAFSQACSGGQQCVLDSECQNGLTCIQGACVSGSGGSCTREGQTRSCYTGPKETRNKGACKDGTQKCDATGNWQSCEGEVKPTGEICGNGKDDDCNGKVDDLKPTEEKCDGVDNDCDGKVDNIPGGSDPLKQDCFTGPAKAKGVGPCKGGKQICKNGKWDKCDGEVLPKAELCSNKIDEDCDGLLDNVKDLGQPCTNEGVKGPCRNGVYTCAKDGRRICRPKDHQGKESCNGEDDDCDGRIDNPPGTTDSLFQPCYTGPSGTQDKGACKSGKTICQNGKWSTTCVGQALPKKETCNGKDDDCDGRVDFTAGSSKPLVQSCYFGPAETKGKGPCKGGTHVCENGKWSSDCKGSVIPKEELCGNRIDEDCDGIVDNVKLLGQRCQDANRKGNCKSGVYKCVGQQRQCVAQGAFAIPAQTEECNGLDDDCDGRVDNVKGQTTPISKTCYNGPANTQRKGLCRDGKRFCRNGNWSSVCTGETRPHPELCNKKDDDCNGKVDDGNACASCTSGSSRPCFDGPIDVRNRGACSGGTETCAGGKWSGKCSGAVSPQKETCNGKDDDCDGKTDNVEGSSLPIFKSCYTGPSGTQGKGDCRSGVQRCVSASWESNCQAQSIPIKEICDGKDNDCDGKTDEDFVCFGQGRGLKERCSKDPKALSYQKCKAGLACIQANKASAANTFCYQKCNTKNDCSKNKDRRVHCLQESPGLNICLAREPNGAPCSEAKGIICGNGLICDRQSLVCRPPSIAPRFSPCGGDTLSVCGKDDVCTDVTPGASHGNCLKKCSASNLCGSGQQCIRFPKNITACAPIGPKKKDQLCGNSTGGKLKPEQFCAKDLLCYRPAPDNPFGVCYEYKKSCICPKGRICVVLSGGCVWAKECTKTCTTNQICTEFQGGKKACIAKPPVGTANFGDRCSVNNRCRSQYICLKGSTSAGYCTTLDCKSSADCPKTPAGASCEQILTGGRKACAFKCKSNNDCPNGFPCNTKAGYCDPS